VFHEWHAYHSIHLQRVSCECIATERTEGTEDIMISLCSLRPLWLTVFIHLKTSKEFEKWHKRKIDS
jgi:hypothetical protein